MWTKPIAASIIAAGVLFSGVGSAFADGASSTSSPTSTATVTAPTTPPQVNCSADSHWPNFVQGTPTSFDAHDDGVYIGHNPSGGWGLAASHPLVKGMPVGVDFQGALASEGVFKNVHGVKLEQNDSFHVSADGHLLTYNFHNYGWVDSLTFSLACPGPAPITSGSSASSAATAPTINGLTFDLRADGSSLPTRYIHLGGNEVNPGTNPFEVRRVDSDTSTVPAAPILNTGGSAPVASSSSSN